VGPPAPPPARATPPPRRSPALHRTTAHPTAVAASQPHCPGTIFGAHGPPHHISAPSTTPQPVSHAKSGRKRGNSRSASAASQNPGATSGTNHRIEQHWPA
jgi:hypothetical protein